MPWLRFTADYDFSPKAHGGRFTLAYKAGIVANVTRECAAGAIAAGVAVSERPPRKVQDDGDRSG